MSAIAVLLMQFIPMIPSLIKAGTATVDLYEKVHAVIRDDRSMSVDERSQVEALIVESMAIVNDTSRDV